MKILVACEYSGTVRQAFDALGHDVWSADFEPSEDGSNKHYVGDCFDLIHGQSWDMMIAHPPCTHLSVSGARWFKDKITEQLGGIEFFMSLINAPIAKIVVENPVGIMSTRYRKPDQIVQPWMFGCPEFKATCLWLKGLPKLIPTDVLNRPVKGDENWNSWNRVHKCPPGPMRKKLRAWRYPTIATAMADQWGK